MGDFSISSTLAATPERLWSHAVSPAGVNRELRPLLRMTFPRDASDLTDAWRPDVRLFRSWLLLAGFLPIEYDDVAFAEVEPGRRFLERSALRSQRLWEHERILEPTAGGCVLTDRVRFVPRLPWLEPLYAPLFEAVFRLRHWNLRRRFGQAAAGPGAARHR